MKVLESACTKGNLPNANAFSSGFYCKDPEEVKRFQVCPDAPRTITRPFNDLLVRGSACAARASAAHPMDLDLLFSYQALRRMVVRFSGKAEAFATRASTLFIQEVARAVADALPEDKRDEAMCSLMGATTGR